MSEAIFTSTPSNGKNYWDNIEDIEDFFRENNGKSLTWRVTHTAKLSQKIKMYNYLFGPLMNSAVNGFNYIGYSGIDKVSARYKLQAEFAKAELYNEKTKQTEVYLLELSKMPKERLLKFIQDCIFYIEEHLQQRVPDSEEYKNMILTGKAFKTTRFDK